MYGYRVQFPLSKHTKHWALIAYITAWALQMEKKMKIAFQHLDFLFDRIVTFDQLFLCVKSRSSVTLAMYFQQSEQF